MGFVHSSFIAQASTARENIDCFYTRNMRKPVHYICAGGINAALRELI
jgi:hypothetical protein